MILALVKKNIISEDNKEIAIKIIEKQWKNQIAIVWGTEDILTKAKEKEIKLTEKEARLILKNLQRNHDCEYGITWETIDTAIEFFVSERQS